jgi:tRNA(adenine34) deaminase
MRQFYHLWCPVREPKAPARIYTNIDLFLYRTEYNATDRAMDVTDRVMMARCVELSRLAVTKGEYPFGSVIALDGRIAAEAINRTVRDADLSRHAEIIALALARKTLGVERLRRSTLYTNIEPCAMCAYCIREAGLGRVVYAMGSPVMGGLSKWNILRDNGMSDRVPQVFGPVPEVVAGVLLNEAQRAWRDWNPLVWEMIKLRGLLIDPNAQPRSTQLYPAHAHSLWHHLQFLFRRKAAPLAADGPIDDLVAVRRET